MADNTMRELRCGTGQMMYRLFERPPHDAGLSIWVCPHCGALAIHIESAGDIMWYGLGESWPGGLPEGIAHDRAEADAAQREWDETPGGARPPVQEDLPW